MNKKTSILLFSIIYTLISCNEMKSSINNNAICNTQTEILKSIKNQKGVFIIDPVIGKPTVQVHTVGTVDEVSIYILCNNMKTKFPSNNSLVTVSGQVRKSDQTSLIGGYTYYELQLESFNTL